jgi:hypothetical protein
MMRLYLVLRPASDFFGQEFLVVAKEPSAKVIVDMSGTTASTTSARETAQLSMPILGKIWNAWCSPWPLSGRIIAGLASVLVVYCAILVWLGALHTSLFGHDYFIFLDGGWRVLNGQRPHVDFHTAVGPLQALYSAFAMWVAGDNVSTGFGIARAVVTLAFTLWCFLLLRGRFRPAATIAVCGMIALLAGAPFALTSSPFTQSMAMFYNRFGYVLLALIILEGFQPRQFAYLGGLSTGIAIGLLLFLKISFFCASIPLLILSLAPWNGRRVAGVAVGFFLIASGFLIWLRFDVPAVVNDIRMCAVARSTAFPVHRFLRTLERCTLGILLTLALGAIVTALNWNLRPRFLQKVQPIVLALAAVILEPVVSIANQQDAVLILMSFCCMMFAASVTHASSEARPVAAAVALVGVCMALQGCIYDLVGLVYSVQHAARHRGAPGIPRLDAPGLSSLVFEGEFSGVYKYENGPPLVKVVNDGIHLLQANTGPRDGVLALAFVNPFSAALRRPAPRGSATFFSLGMSISAGNYLPAAGLFAEVEAVMVPTYETDESGTTTAMVAQYKEVLERDYVLAAKSDFWLLYRKRIAGQ